jgi:hypothetical protein
MLTCVISKRIGTDEKLVTTQPHTSCSDGVVGADSLWAYCLGFLTPCHCAYNNKVCYTQ